MKYRRIVKWGLLSLVLAGCGTRNLRPGEFPKPNQGLAVIEASLSGTSYAYLHIFNIGDRLGPHKGRITLEEGNDIYAICLPEGQYDVGQLTTSFGTSTWASGSPVPAFKINENTINYLGSIELDVREYGLGKQLRENLNPVNLRPAMGTCGITYKFSPEQMETAIRSLEEKYPHLLSEDYKMVHNLTPAAR